MTTIDDPPVHEDRQRSPWSRPWFIVSAGFVVLLLVMLVWLLLNPAPKGPVGQQPAPAAPATREPAASASVCGLPNGDQAEPKVTPDAQWRELPGGIAAPSDPAIGPGRSGPVPSCYAQSPLGALFAVANFVAVNGQPQARLQAARELTAPGPGQDQAIADLESDLGGSSSGVQVLAFDFFGYDPGRSAVIDLVLSTGNGGMARVPFSVTWRDGDWKVELPPNGSPFAGAKPLASLDGYVRFAGI